MRKLFAEEVLETMIRIISEYLEDLKDFKDREEEQFQYGERTAFTECLEYLQAWDRAKEIGLDFDIEERYPL